MRNYEPIDGECKDCGSSMVWVNCYNCVDGYSHHECGEDPCNCGYPEENVICDICKGKGGWEMCWEDYKKAHLSKEKN